MENSFKNNSSLNILIAGKEELLRISLEDDLNAQGFSTLCVASTLEAQKELQNNYYDILLTDLHSPELDSPGLLKWVQEKNNKVKILIMTTYASIPEAKKGIKLGAYDYIIKPFSLDEMILKLNHILRLKNVITENERLKEKVKFNTETKR